MSKWSNAHMMPMSNIDPDEYPTLHRYWQALRKDPTQPNLPKWMIKNRDKLDREITKWAKAFKASKG